jgi:hypothetical protein
MKKLLKLSVAFVCALSLTFTSCKKTEDDVTAPSITVNNGVASVNQDLSIKTFTVNYTASASGTKKLKTVTVERAITGQASVTISTKSFC